MQDAVHVRKLQEIVVRILHVPFTLAPDFVVIVAGEAFGYDRRRFGSIAAIDSCCGLLPECSDQDRAIRPVRR
jgi:hypothetical protein